MLSTIEPGVKYILLSGIFFGLVNASVKFLSRIPSYEIVFFRAVITLLITYYFLYKRKIKILDPNWKPLVSRGITGSIALTLYFYTIQTMPIASAVTILYLAPIFTLIFAAVFLKEKPHKLQYPLMIVAFIGAALVKNFDPRIQIADFLLGLIAAMFAGMAYTLIRYLRGKVDPLLVIFYFPLLSIPIVIPFLLKGWVTPNIVELLCLLFVGVTTQIAQVFLTHAFMKSPPARIGHFQYFIVVYALLTGFFLFNESINWISMIGILVLILGVYGSNLVSRKTTL